MKDQGLTYCRKEKCGIGKAIRTSEKYCSVCNMKRRGKNHDWGTHHKQATHSLKG